MHVIRRIILFTNCSWAHETISLALESLTGTTNERKSFQLHEKPRFQYKTTLKVTNLHQLHNNASIDQ